MLLKRSDKLVTPGSILMTDAKLVEDFRNGDLQVRKSALESGNREQIISEINVREY